MKQVIVYSCVLLICGLVRGNWFAHLEERDDELEGDQTDLHGQIETLTRQLSLQQFFTEQRVRSEGQSGIKLVRQRRGGNKNFFTETHTGYAAASIHDHSNNIRTVGLGEFSAVLNGVEFTTRHNDYRLFEPSRNTENYDEVEPIHFPDVPQEVTDKATLEEQIVEMRKWFEAWSKEDETIRPYKNYFPSLLCYLEGAWTNSKKSIEEPFSSDRHRLDAKSWIELHDKARYTAYSGSKSLNENFAFLPTKIMEVLKSAEGNTVPKFAQWNYRIVCHRTKDYIPKSRLKVVEDLSSRMMQDVNMYRHFHSRAARFHFDDQINRPTSKKNFLDGLMEQIPGKNNYKGEIFEDEKYYPALDEQGNKMNVAYYHRSYKVERNDAMGQSFIKRGFNDDFLYVAQTTHPEVAGMNVTKCLRGKCEEFHEKYTYAIPLELIYLNPLYKWNPLNLKYHGEYSSTSPANADRRWGSCKDGENKELNGTNSKRFYQTPYEFFTGNNNRGLGDTVPQSVCVLDQQGAKKRVKASGTRVLLPYIKDLGVLRQRYPVFPVHGEGASVWKEVNAMREIVLNIEKWQHMLVGEELIDDISSKDDVILEMGDAKVPHTHDVRLTANQVVWMKAGHTVKQAVTEEANGHSHTLEVRWDKPNKQFYYSRCDGSWKCKDEHPKPMTVKQN